MVPGYGPQPSLAMIVGEAPGVEEEKLGRPFVGRSGKMLDTGLSSVGIAREGCYLTYVVKEVPTRDGKVRAPFPDEIEEWGSILRAEVEATSPACILALGKTATFALTDIEDKVPPGSKVGNVWTAWHPTYVNNNRRLLSEWVQQLLPWAEALNVAMFEVP